MTSAGIATDIGTGDSGVQGFRVADPGGNLLSGYVPSIARTEWPLTLMASNVTRGYSGMNVSGYRDYRGVSVVGSWLWSDELGIGLATEIDSGEALAPYLAMRNLVIGVLGITVLLALALTGFSVWLGDRAKVRLERLVASGRMPSEAARSRIEAQRSLLPRFDEADEILHNDDDRDALARRIDDLLARHPGILPPPSGRSGRRT